MNDSSHDHMAHALPTVASTAIPHDHSQHLTAGNTMEHMMSMAVSSLTYFFRFSTQNVGCFMTPLSSFLPVVPFWL